MNLFSKTIPNENISYLISRDTKGKIRIAILSYELVSEENNRYFIIEKNKALDGEDFDRQFDLKELEKNMAATNMVIFTVGVILIIGVIIFTIIGSN